MKSKKIIIATVSTIVAIATAPGAGGIAVVRLSGPRSYQVAEQVFRPANAAKSVAQAKGYTALFGHFVDGGEKFDEGVALFFRAPHSYTGEDVVELSCHGGSAVARRLVEACLAAGAQPAAPGEYTRRAFLNGKLGLTQAEAVMDLISADGRQGAALANAALSGALARKIGEQKDALTALQAHLAAWVDFPEEDVPELDEAHLRSVLGSVQETLDGLIRNYQADTVLREGVDCAIVGRPNVGKSMLFNKIIGRRLSIVEDTPGVTRDRIYGESEWVGRRFRLVDTGGIEPNTDSQILSFMREQAQIAIDNADVIIFVTDIKTGLTASDQEVASMLQRSRKPIVLAVNKMDSVGAVDPDFYEFYNLGLGDPVAVSAVHGHGTGDLLDECIKYFPLETDEEDDSDVVQVAIIGKPNVGKSSLTNRILGEERVIVSNVAGTTRDAIDSYFENQYGKYNFIDTAGMRKKSKVDDNIEKYSVLRATMAIERSDVCLILIDAQEGVTEQDTKVAGLAHDAGKACIIVVNKWDLIEKDDKTMDRMREDIRRDLSYMPYAPILFISALTGQRVGRLFELINYVNDQAAMRITTGTLNSVLADAQTRVQPPTDKGRRLKIYYMTQVGVKPPHFVIFCNDKKLFHFSYQRYLENQLRSVFGLEGTPIVLTIRQKGEDDG